MMVHLQEMHYDSYVLASVPSAGVATWTTETISIYLDTC